MLRTKTLTHFTVIWSIAMKSTALELMQKVVGSIELSREVHNGHGFADFKLFKGEDRKY